MSDFTFNIALGRVREYASLPAANDALILVLLQSTGLQTDATLRDHDNLSVLLAASNDEATFTGYVRKTVSSGITITVDDTNDWLDIDMADQVWALAGGAVNNTIAKLLICYDPDIGAGTDTTIVPLAAHDINFTTDGSDATVQFQVGGFWRAA